MARRRLRRAADKGKIFINHFRIDDIAELCQSTVHTMLQFERIKSFRLIQLAARQNKIADGLITKINARDRYLAAYLTFYFGRTVAASGASR